MSSRQQSWKGRWRPGLRAGGCTAAALACLRREAPGPRLPSGPVQLVSDSVPREVPAGSVLPLGPSIRRGLFWSCVVTTPPGLRGGREEVRGEPGIRPFLLRASVSRRGARLQCPGCGLAPPSVLSLPASGTQGGNGGAAFNGVPLAVVSVGVCPCCFGVRERGGESA